MPVRKTAIGFAIDMRKSALALELGTVEILERMALGIGSRTIKRTPILNGTLAANFQYSEGPSLQQTDKGARGSSGSAERLVLARGRAIKWSKMGRYTFGNYLPYAERIEFEGWSHTKAPDGMLRLAVQAELAVFDTHVKDVMRQKGLL